jgi:hypothetical protein
MKKRTKIVIVVMALAVLLSTAAYSQSSARGRSRGSSTQEYILTVRSNVKGASVHISGELRGEAPTRVKLEEGTYTVHVKANGYRPFNTVVKLDSNTTIDANLQQREYNLTVTCNVQGANVYINGSLKSGGTPLTITNLEPGTYTIRIKAPGYFEGSANVNLNNDKSVNINLQPARATVIPVKPHPDFKVFLDGQQIFEPTRVQPGEHTISYTIGALETQNTFYFEAGKNYRIQPALSLSIGY